MYENIEKKIILFLIKKNYNIGYIEEIKKKFYLDKKNINIDDLIYKSKYIQIHTNIEIELTKEGIEYSNFLIKNNYEKIILHINNLSGFYTVLIAFFALICSVLAIIISLK